MTRKIVSKNRKKMKPEDKKKLVNKGLVVFGISIVLFTLIGALVMDNFANLQQVEDLSATEEDGYKGEIDDRLRFIAMQDDDKAELREKESSDVQEDLNEPADIISFLNNDEEKMNKFEEYNEKHKKKTSQNSDNVNSEHNDNNYNMDEIPYKKNTTANTLNLKVVIGNFDTKEAAQEELMQVRSQFTASPIVKYLNGKYCLQVAAFKTPETAYEFANSLRHQGYSARVIEE